MYSQEGQEKSSKHDGEDGKEDNIPSVAKFLVGIWQYKDEITLVMDESNMELFPDDTLEASPQKWKGIKLCGRPIGFDEFGFITGMSKVGVSSPSLNISTALTNITLVPEETLDSSILFLSHELKCPIDEEFLSM